MKKQTILIADKDPCAREQLRNALEQQQYPAVFWECSNGMEAVKYINALQPEVVFINASLPGIGGFNVLDAVTHSPLVILSSDCPHDAVRAFEYDVLDYLSHPISPPQLRRTIQRLRSPSWHPVQSPLSLQTNYPSRIFVEKGQSLTKIDVAMITHLKADRDYTWIHTYDNESYLSNYGIGDLTHKMDPSRFMRIHRSYIVNLDYVQELYKDVGRFYVTLPNEIAINVGKNYVPVIKELLF